MRTETVTGDIKPYKLRCPHTFGHEVVKHEWCHNCRDSVSSHTIFCHIKSECSHYHWASGLMLQPPIAKRELEQTVQTRKNHLSGGTSSLYSNNPTNFRSVPCYLLFQWIFDLYVKWHTWMQLPILTAPVTAVTQRLNYWPRLTNITIQQLKT